MAAALIAALFAMGVFAPAGVEAGVKGDPGVKVKITKDGVETRKPGTEGATIQVTFELSDTVDGAEGTAPHFDDVTIDFNNLIPAAFTFDADNITVEQSGSDVGKFVVRGATDITTDADLQITYGANPGTESGSPFAGTDDSGNGVVRADSLVTVTITDVTLGAAIGAGHNVVVTQTASFKQMTVAIGPTITSSSIELSDTAASSDDDDADDTTNMAADPGENVKMTIKVKPDTANAGDAAGDNIVITLPAGDAYDLDTVIDPTDTSDTGALVSVSPSTVVPTVADAGTGDTITLHTFDADKEITVTITDLTNPSTSTMYSVNAKQGDVTADKGVSLPVHVTDAAQVKPSTPMLDNRDAGGTGMMTFTFEAVQEVKDDDSKVKVTLSDEFTGFRSSNVKVQQMNDDEKYEGRGMVMAGSGNMFYIAKNADAKKNVMAGEKVMVTIDRLTNPDEVGMVNDPVKVMQGGFATGTSDNVGIQGAELSTTTPGADVRVEISTRAMMKIPGGDDIAVTLEGFGIPDTIDESDVRIEGGSANNVNPSDVSVSGSKVTISLPTTDARDMDYNIPAETDYTIVFKQGAGLTNPTSGGTKDITVSDMDDDNHEMTVTIKSSVSVKPSFVARGGDATVTAKGLEDGTATVHLQEGRARSDSDMVLGSGTAEDGVVEIVIDTSDLERGATRDGDIDKGDNTLYVKDASNDFVGETTIGIKPTIKLGSDSVKRSGKLEITVSDWYYGANATVTIGGESAGSHTIDGHKDTIEVTVPADVRFGKQEVKVSGSNPRGLKTFSVTAEATIDALSINISPSTVVPGAQVTITGSGYVKDTEVREILIGDKRADLPDERDDREATSAGRIAYTITVPLDVGNGEKDVQVTVGTRDDERVGVGEITVPKPAIELDPATSVPGSVISVNGSGFASSGRVEVRYKDAIEEVGRADSSGDFHIRLEIPSDAGVGKTNTVKVEVRGTTSINAEAEHKTPGSAITVPETAQVGTLITLSGTNFEPFSNLDVRIGGRDATPSPGPETDKNGAFEFEARVPRLAAGSHTVTIMDAEDNSVSETFSVVTSPIVSTPEEVFGVLGDKLVSVWSLDNATKAWSAYFPGAPEGVSDLTGVSRVDIVWVNVSEDVMFQGGMLTTGWNLISLE